MPCARRFASTAARVLDAGVDVLLLETFRQPEEIHVALEAALETAAGRVPVVASVSFDPFGTMADGTGPEQMAQKLAGWGAAAIGVNCADGPAGVYEMVTRMRGVGLADHRATERGPAASHRRSLRVHGDARVLPALRAAPVQGRREGGRRLLRHDRRARAQDQGRGAHDRRTDEARRRFAAARPRRRRRRRHARRRGAAARGRARRRGHAARGEGPARAEARAQKFVVSVEVNPPPGLSLDKAIEGARLLRDAGVDAINVADGPRASARMGNLALCMRIQRELSMPALMHVTTRDRNLLGLIAHLLAAHELDVHNLVVITGDPPKMGDFPDATPVYDLDSVGLLRLIAGAQSRARSGRQAARAGHALPVRDRRRARGPGLRARDRAAARRRSRPAPNSS